MLLGIKFVHWLVILSVFISIAGSYAYIRDTIKGQTKPNRISWFIWALAPILGTFAAISSDADIWATVRVFLAGLLPLLVFIASFVNKNSYWKLQKYDWGFGIAAVVGVLLWIFADSPRSAILFLALADGFAVIPTVMKAWKNPETETGLAYVAGLVGVLIILPSIPVWNIENSAFQIYLMAANTLLVFSVYRLKIKHWIESNFIRKTKI